MPEDGSPRGAPGGELAYVALGSNLGDREGHLLAALRSLETTPGVELLRASRVFETAPVGPLPQGPYLNAVVMLRARLAPRALLERLLAIEATRGRSRAGPRGAARTLDLDLLLLGNRVADEPGLVLPHPRLHQRAFVLAPLCDLAPRRVHPVLGRTLAELLASLGDPTDVRPYAFRGRAGSWPAPASPSRP